MKRFLFPFALIAAALLNFGCAASPPSRTLTQISTIDALLAGRYDGQMRCGDLAAYGDFGTGTFDGLDGEMVLLNGVVYRVRADGKVDIPGANVTTPFASVVRFDGNIEKTIPPGATLPDIQKAVDEAVPNLNVFCAVRIDGTFSSVRTRSVPAQKKPYPPLVEVTKNQPEFLLQNVSGTLVGFRCPAFVKGINVPGYHLHFLTDDRSAGGHVLECTVASVKLKAGAFNRFLMILPENEKMLGGLDFGADRSAELERVEKKR